MLWTCLRFSRLALDAVCIDSTPEARRKPLAVVDGPVQRRHVVVANAAAQAAGVRAGHVLAAAQMLCPRLTVVARDADAERQTLQTLAAWAYRFSAEVSIAEPYTLLIEVGGSLALFEGWPALQRRLRSELDGFGFGYALAAAATAAGAEVLATHADGVALPDPGQLVTALAGVPLGSSGLGAKVIAALHGMGFRQLGDLFRLPRAELSRRIGEDALDHLDRMRGLIPEALSRYRPPDRFERRIEFSFGVESQGALTFPLQRLIRELALFLIARDGGVQRFSLVLGHERGASTRVEVGLIAPQRDATSLFDLARVRLERIDLGAPVHALTLIAEDLPPLCPIHRDLFDTHRNEQLDWPALAERLRARLGDESLRGLRCVADHRPGRAWRFVPATGGVGSREENHPQALAGTKNPRPFWLLARPQPLHRGPRRVIAGPERIETGWWDEHDQRRDYYVIETHQGQRAWAFVEAGTTHNWTLHGWFA